MSRPLPDKLAERPEPSSRWHPLAYLFLTFVGLAALWFVLWLVPLTFWESPSLRRTSRALGYVALAALLVPYIHIGRRLLLNRRAVLGIPLGNLTGWMWWHLGAAYLAFFFSLIHCRAHASGWLTFVILVLVWAVMVSGVVGFFGTRVCYRLLALTVEREVGLERLAGEREELSERSRALVRNYALLREEDVVDWHGFGSKILQKGSALNAKLVGALGKGVVTVIEDALRSGSFTAQLQAEVVEKVNAQLKKPEFSRGKDFQDLDASASAGNQPHETAGPARLAAQSGRQQRLAKKIAHWAANQPKSDRETERRNRVFLEAMCPSEIAESMAPPEAVERFFEQAAIYLQTGYPSWTWLFSSQALEPVSRNHYLRVRELASPEQRQGIDELWGFVQRRRQVDIEYWFHRLARVWLLVHGPAAWALLVLVVAHAISSIYYGGFF